MTKQLALMKVGQLLSFLMKQRTLRFISPIVNKEGKIELVGHCWRADFSEWGESSVFLKDIISKKGFTDEFSALKHIIHR